MNVTAHFAVSEFDRPHRVRNGVVYRTAPYPIRWLDERLKPLCLILEELRAALGGKPIQVTSGYRDPQYNRAIGGARRSQHMEGRAADIVVAGVSAEKVHETALHLHEEGYVKIGGLGRYPGFAHIDVRPTTRLVRWTGSRADS